MASRGCPSESITVVGSSPLHARNAYRYIVYVGQTTQGRKLVEDVLIEAALEMTRESTDEDIQAAMERIRAGARSTNAVDAIRQFEAALREAIDEGCG